MSAFYNYMEPFSAKYRAFGRLHETGYEELAVPCFGYVLLDEHHERAMMERFSDLDLDFNGTGDAPASRTPGQSFLAEMAGPRHFGASSRLLAGPRSLCEQRTVVGSYGR